MRSIHLIPILLICFLLFASAQEIDMKPVIIIAPEISQDYSIVGQFLYPSSSIFVSTLPKDFYVNKLKEAKISKPDISAIIAQQPNPLLVLFDNQLDKEITSIPTNAAVPTIQDYHVVKIIYPFAKFPQEIPQSIPIAPVVIQQQNPSKPVDAPAISVNAQPYKQVNNQNKKIEWKIKDLPALNDFIVDENQKITMENSLIKGQVGTAQIGIEGVKTPQEQQKSLRQQPKQQRPQIVHPVNPPSRPVVNVPNNQQKEPITFTNKQILEEIERLRLKNHRWTLLIVILILVILLLAFLFMRCLGKRNVDFWQNINKKLDGYRGPAVPIDEEDQGMHTKNTELVQSEFE